MASSDTHDQRCCSMSGLRDVDVAAFGNDGEPDLPYYIDLEGDFSIRHANTGNWNGEEPQRMQLSPISKRPRHGAVRPFGASGIGRRWVQLRRTRYGHPVRHRVT
jgi:hypothetical protein